MEESHSEQKNNICKNPGHELVQCVRRIGSGSSENKGAFLGEEK